jgi:FkbM family methyltransferase
VQAENIDESRLRNLMRKTIRKLQVCCKTIYSIPKEKKHNIISVKPNYKIVDNLSKKSIIVDIGTGANADFSQELIDLYGLKSYGFDPTRKHHPLLDLIVEKRRGFFKYYKYAMSNKCGTKPFYESLENVSGSFFRSHCNVKRDEIRTYDVKTVTLDSIFGILNTDHIDLLKMDIEGEEYSVFNSVTPNTLKKIDQIVVEFHHNSVENFSVAQTRSIIQILKKSGFLAHTIDDENFLFYQLAKIADKK